DFLYLPYDPAEGANEGFGLVSFLRPSVARDFYREFNGTFLRVAPVQGKALYVHASPIQGFAELYEKFKPDPNSHQDPKCSPLFLRRPPATLASRSSDMGVLDRTYKVSAPSEHAVPQRPKVSRGVARRLCPRCSTGLQDSVCPNCGAKVQAEFEVARSIANPHPEAW
ncbi:ML5, partial [Symbiodinium necroappetens]